MCNSCPQNLQRENQVYWGIPICYAIEGGIGQSLSKASKRKPDVAEQALISHIMATHFPSLCFLKILYPSMVALQFCELSHQDSVILMGS